MNSISVFCRTDFRTEFLVVVPMTVIVCKLGIYLEINMGDLVSKFCVKARFNKINLISNHTQLTGNIQILFLFLFYRHLNQILLLLFLP